ncbi:hypothetical protein CVT26_001870 [Gymnopilus dilepis]|uniref:CHAT domain-containing protein n=1 Tax=Gymnopilus dilepis TaxID=231916 RepID=A0A409Y3U7_9AGAR|nr:hypothetical protein CVT26_001870 [Gymnopilus dilepis]
MDSSIDELISAVRETKVASYMWGQFMGNRSGLAFLVCDALSTLSREVEYIWRLVEYNQVSQGGFITAVEQRKMVECKRAISFHEILDAIPNGSNRISFSTRPSKNLSRGLNDSVPLVSSYYVKFPLFGGILWVFTMGIFRGGYAILLLAVDVIFSIRLYALYKRSKKILALLISLVLGEFVVQAYVASKIGASTADTLFLTPSTLPILGCLTSPDLRITTPSWQVPGERPNMFDDSDMSPLAIYFVLMLFKFYESVQLTKVVGLRSSLPPLIRAFVRDGTIYFLLVLVTLLAGALDSFLTKGPYVALYAPCTVASLAITVSFEALVSSSIYEKPQLLIMQPTLTAKREIWKPFALPTGESHCTRFDLEFWGRPQQSAPTFKSSRGTSTITAMTTRAESTHFAHETVEGGLADVDRVLTLVERCLSDVPSADLEKTISLLQELIADVGVSSNVRMNSLLGLAVSLGVKFARSKGQEGLQEYLEVESKMREVSTASTPDQDFLEEGGTRLRNLKAAAQKSLSEIRESMALSLFSIDVSMPFLHQCLVILPASHPKRIRVVQTLGNVSFLQFASQLKNTAEMKFATLVIRHNLQTFDENEQWGLQRYLQFLEASVSIAQMYGLRMKDRAEPHSTPSAGMSSLDEESTQILEHQADPQTEVADISTAIGSLPTELTATDYTMNMGSQAKALFLQFTQDGDVGVLQKSILLSKQALQLIPAAHPEHFVVLTNLGSGMQALYHQGGVHENLDEAITLFKRAAGSVPANHPLWIGSLDKLAGGLYAHYHCTSNPEDLRDAILLSKRALELRSPEDPDLCVTLNNLATGLLAQFEQEGNSQILQEAISLSMQALKLTLQLPIHRVASLSNLSVGFHLRFEAEGKLQDLENAISFSRQTLQFRTAPHPERYMNLNELANQLLTRFEHQGRVSDLNEAISLHSEALELTPPPHPAHTISANNLANSLLIRAEAEGSGNSRDIDKAISIYKQILQLTTLPQNRIDPLNNLAGGLVARFDQQGNIQDLEEAILLYKQALELTPISHSTRPQSLAVLARMHLNMFELRGNPQHLDETISLSKQALELTPPPHRHRVPNLKNLSLGLQKRFEQRGDAHDLDEAIAVDKQVLELETEPDSDRVQSLDVLSQALLTRFYQQGHSQDLDEAITLCEEALHLSPKPDSDRADSLNNLASALFARFEQHGNVQDLNNSIALCKRAVELEHRSGQVQATTDHADHATALPKRSQQLGSDSVIDDNISFLRQTLERMPIGHPSRAFLFNSLGLALQSRFDQQGEAQDLDDAITVHAQAIESTPKFEAIYVELLINLATELHMRYDHKKDLDDLFNAVLRFRGAIDMLSPSHPARPTTLINLAITLLAQFRSKGDEQDLNDAIAVSKEALTFEYPSHSVRAALVNTHANALLARFEQSGDVRDLDEAVSAHRSALKPRSPSDPVPFNSLHNLASVLFARFNERGDDKDIDEAISLQRQALELRPHTGSDNLPTLRSLAVILMTRFQRKNNVQDLDQAISLHRQALECVPAGDPSRVTSIINLSTALSSRFDRQGAFEDIDEAITLCRQAIDLVSPSYTFYASLHFNFAGMLSARFREQGSVSDFNEALATFEKTLTLLPANDPRRPSALCNFAKLHVVARQKLGQQASVELAVSLLSEATQSPVQSPARRWSCAVQWAQYADEHQHPSALEAFEVALAVSAELAAVGLGVQSHQGTIIERTDELARRAAQCAINAGDLGKAVEFLETGRSVFWSKALNLKTPIDQLHDVAPQLAADLRRIAAGFAQEPHRESNLLSNSQVWADSEGGTNALERLAAEWAEKVGQVRKLDGFEDFLRPKSLSTLQSAATERPVVYLVANDSSSDCLILASGHIHHIPLTTLPAHVLSELVRLVKIGISDPVVAPVLASEAEESGVSRERDDKRHPSSGDPLGSVLESLWNELVQPVIQSLGLKGLGRKTTLTWCPTGLFSFLPVHAAGRYADAVVECASQYLISSYTPTIGALLMPDHPPVTPFRMMIVVQSHSSPNAMEEMMNIEQHVNNDNNSLIKFGTSESPASVEAVASCLPQASIVHFACHGKQDPRKPLKSGLVIENEILTISRIMKEPLLAGSLAFLSACETATRDESVIDEAITVGASLMFGGFERVVATMWRNQDGPAIANAFYRELFSGVDGNPMTVPDTSKYAEALSIAVEELRSRGVEFRRWVPFIHMGK